MNRLNLRELHVTERRNNALVDIGRDGRLTMYHFLTDEIVILGMLLSLLRDINQ